MDKIPIKRSFYIFAAIIVTAFSRYAIPPDARLYYSESILSALVALLLYIQFSCTTDRCLERLRQRKREGIATVLLAALLSSFLVWGAAAVNNTPFDPFSLTEIMAIVVCTYPLFLGLESLWHLLDNARPSVKKSSSFTLRLFSRFPTFKHWPWLIFTLFLAAWLPYYLASWPGFFCYDLNLKPHHEFAQFLSGDFNTRMPLFHVLLLGTIVDFGTNLFGGLRGGVALFTAFQTCVTALIFTWMVTWIRKRCKHRWLSILSVIYLAFNPVVAMFIMCDSRDVLFCVALLPVCMLAHDLANDTPHGRNKLLAGVGLFFFCIIASITRRNGIVAVLIILFLLFALSKKRNSVLLGSLVAALLVSCFWYGPITNLLCKKDNAREESLAVPIQQLAYITTFQKTSSLENSYLASIGYEFPNDNYRTDISDGSKFTIGRISSTNLLKAYIALGLRHPTDYFTAELLRGQDAWNPYSYIDCYNGLAPSYEDRETSFFSSNTEIDGEDFSEITTSKFPMLLEFIKMVSRELFFQRIPLLGLLVSLPFYTWVLLVALVRSISLADRSKLNGSLVITLIFLSAYISVYFGPAVLPRYYLFLIFGFPLMMYSLLERNNIQDEGKGVVL